MSLPRGITYRYVAKLFRNGYTVKGLSLIFKCDGGDIYRAIRTVLQRQKAYR